MTDLEKRAHDLTIASISLSSDMKSQEVYESYTKRYFEIYDYLKEKFIDED